MKKQSLEERWISKIDESSDDDSCWLWIGSRSTQGYGQMCVNKKQVLAHQIGWQLAGRSLCRGKKNIFETSVATNSVSIPTTGKKS
jgi:hypothetical protein